MGLRGERIESGSRTTTRGDARRSPTSAASLAAMVVVGGALLLIPSVLHGQVPATPPRDTSADRVFGGVLLVSSGDASNRIAFGQSKSDGVPWQIEAGFNMTPRLRLAGELSFWGRRSSAWSSPDRLRRDRQEEKVAQMTARYLLLAAPRLALHAVGGAGVLFDDYALTVRTTCVNPPPGPQCDFLYPKRHRYVVLSGGAEFALRALPHLDVAGSMRVASLVRPDRRYDPLTDDTRRRVTVWLGIGPRLVW